MRWPPNPVATWPLCTRLVVLGVALLGVLIGMFVQRKDAATLKRLGGVGIIGFELIGSWERATPLLNRWNDVGKAAARRTLWWDSLLYVPAYVTLLATTLGTAASHARSLGWSGWAWAGVVGVVAVVVAGACDIVENIGLFGVLRGNIATRWPAVATGFAKAKWALIGAVAVLLLTYGELFLAPCP